MNHEARRKSAYNLTPQKPQYATVNMVGKNYSPPPPPSKNCAKLASFASEITIFLTGLSLSNFWGFPLSWRTTWFSLYYLQIISSQ
ncbi:MAG: hypothetical protein LBF87_01430 [Treponema sp.]|jgi:hypothetical protein|nr:hypothetical protein [Treponema sp.]